MQQEKTDIKSMNLEELKSYMESIGEKPFRAKQLYQWMHEKQAASFDEMTNLSKSLQEKLKNECRFVSLKQEAVQISKIDGTRKYLFALDDGNVIESVLMRYKHGNSVCISSRVGLPDGLPVLCIHVRRTGAGTDAVRDVRPDIPDHKRYRGEGCKCCCDGNRRTDG